MARRRFLYLLVLLASTVFYWANQQWLGWMLFLSVICLPVLSLILSLPALFSLKLRMNCPLYVHSGTEVCAQVSNQSRIPSPGYDCVISVYKPLTQESLRLKNGEALPTECCGKLYCSIEKIRISDYLGLFRFRLGTGASATLTVRPKPITFTQLPQFQQRAAGLWKPKPGGGFAENHEIRLYRPGDHLNQIHWKLSAKTGKLVIREPMIPFGRQAVVGLCLFGSDKALEEKFGKLMGVGRYLLDRGMPFDLRAITEEGVVTIPVSTEQELIDAVDKLLGMEPAAQEQELSDYTAHIYWIGGQANEE